MKNEMLKRLSTVAVVFLLAALACAAPIGSKSTTPAQGDQTAATADALLSQSTVGSLWYLTRGSAKLDQGWGTDVDEQGNIYFATYQQAEGELFTDMVIYKFSPLGDELWKTRWGGQYQEKAFVIQVDGADVYVGGTQYSSAVDLNAGEMVVLALDTQSGNLKWDFTWGQGYGYEEVDGLVVEPDGIYISGWTTSEKSLCDVGLLKLDKQGQIIWTSVWGTERWDEADGQMVVDEQYIYIAGRIDADNIAFGGDALLAKFNKSDGSYVQHVTWGGKQFDDALGMTSDGTYLYPVGLTLSKGNGGQIFLLKYDKDLNLQWEQVWGGPKGESARSAAIDPNGDILIAGETSSYGSGGNDIVLLSYAYDGTFRWSKTWGGEQNEGALDIVMLGWNTFIATNTRSYGAGEDEALLIKADGQTGIFPEVDTQRK